MRAHSSPTPPLSLMVNDTSTYHEPLGWLPLGVFFGPHDRSSWGGHLGGSGTQKGRNFLWQKDHKKFPVYSRTGHLGRGKGNIEWNPRSHLFPPNQNFEIPPPPTTLLLKTESTVTRSVLTRGPGKPNLNESVRPLIKPAKKSIIGNHTIHSWSNTQSGQTKPDKKRVCSPFLLLFFCPLLWDKSEMLVRPWGPSKLPKSPPRQWPEWALIHQIEGSPLARGFSNTFQGKGSLRGGGVCTPRSVNRSSQPWEKFITLPNWDSSQKGQWWAGYVPTIGR